MRTFEGPSWIIIGVAICLYAYKMGLGSFREPGAGFIAFVTGLFLLLVGAFMFTGKKGVLQRIPKKEKREIRNSESPAFRLVYGVALLFLYALLLEHLGYILTTILVMFGFFYAMGSRHLFGLAFTAAIVSAGMTYIVFEIWLHTQLPRGLFPWW